MPSITKYNLSFTAFGLGVQHACALARVFEKVRSWEKAKEEALSGNVFQQSRASSLKRLEREFRLRLQALTSDQLELLIAEPEMTGPSLALLAVFKRYAIVCDFCTEVLWDKWTAQDFELRASDYASFIENKETAHPELLEISDSSAKKLNQVTLRILTEGGLLTRDKPKCIMPVILPTQVVEVISKEEPQYLRAFLQS
jgi:hypothetical protein